MDRRGFILAALALGSCATVAGPTVVARGHGPLAELEPVYSVVAGRQGVTVQVASNGCTAKTDFAFYADQRGETVGLAFARNRVDTCKSFAQGRADLAFTWQELGLGARTSIFLLNPLMAWTGPGS